MFCTNCGNKLKDDSVFCSNCGKKLVDEKTSFCTNCGNKLKDGNKFCDNCGKPLNGEIKQPVKKVNKKIKQLDALLKIGVVMVLISGLILATSNYEAISNIAKIIILFLISLLFTGLSVISDKYIKLENTTKSYSITGFAFLIFTVFAIDYFEIFNYSNGSLLLSLISLLTSCYAYFYNKKFESKISMNICKMTSYTFALFLFNFVFKEKIEYALLVTTPLLIASNFIKNDDIKDWVNLPRILNIITLFAMSNNANYIELIVALLGVIDIFIYNLKLKKDHWLTMISSFVIAAKLANIIYGILPFPINELSFSVVTILLYGLYLLTYSLKKKETSKLLKNTALSFVGISVLLAIGDEVVPYNFFISSIIFLIATLLSMYVGKNKKYTALRTIAILIVALSSLTMINYYLVSVDGIVIFTIIGIATFIISLLEKDVSIKSVDLGLTGLVLLIASFIGAVNPHPINELSGIVSLLLLGLNAGLYIVYLKENEVLYRRILYYAGLIYLMALLLPVNILGLDLVYLGFIVLAILMTIYLVNKDKAERVPTLLYMLYPLAFSLNGLGISSEVAYTIVSVFASLLVVLAATNFKEKGRNITLIAASILLLTANVFTGYIGSILYVGITGIILIVYGIVSKHDSFFTIGIVFTIFNILYSLRNVWNSIPGWLYLLLGGIAIIGVGSYLLLKDKKD